MVAVNMGRETQGHWEAVPSKAQKKAEPTDKKESKGAPKTATKLNYASGSLASQTTTHVKSAFAALDALSKKQNEAEGFHEDDSEEEEMTTKPSSGEVPVAKKVKQPKVKKVKVTIAETAAGVLETTMLAEALQNLEETYPNNPEVQLSMCANFFEKTFRAVELPFNKILREEPLAKSVEFLLKELPQATAKKVQQWLSHRPAAAASKFVLEVLQVVMETAGGPVSGGKKSNQPTVDKPVPVGLLIVLALVLRAHPEALLPHATIIRTNRKFQGAERLHILVWACGQAAVGSAAAGVGLWARTLLPLVEAQPTSKSAELAMAFIDTVLPPPNKAKREQLEKRAAKVGGPSAVVPVDTLMSVLQFAFLDQIRKEDEKPKALAPTVARLRELYPSLRKLALAPGGRSGRTAQNLVAASMDMLAHCQVAMGQDKGNRSLAQKLVSTGGVKEAAGGGDLYTMLVANFLWGLQADPEQALPQWPEQYSKYMDTADVWMTSIMRAWGKPELAGLVPFKAQFLEAVLAIRALHAQALMPSLHLTPKRVAIVKSADQAARVLAYRLRPTSSAATCIKWSIVVGLAAAAGLAASGYKWSEFQELLEPDSMERARVARELQSVKLLLVDSVQRNAAYLQAQVQSLQSMLKGVAATK